MNQEQLEKAIINLADTARTNPEMEEGEVMEVVGLIVETVGSIFLLAIEKLDEIVGELEEMKEQLKDK